MESFSINNTESFRQLYSRYYKALMLYAMKMTEDEETAEDIVQNVFLHLWENREIFDDENVVRNFLYLSVRRRAIDHARHVKVEGKYKEYALGNDEATEAAWEDSEAFKSEIYRRLMEAINELPPRQREIFLHYMQGKKNTEIAQMMNISEETIRVQRKRALKTLRKKVGDKYIIFPSNPQPIGFSGILLAKRQNSFYCTYFLHNRNVADTKSPYPIKRLEVIRWFNQKSMVFNQSLS